MTAMAIVSFVLVALGVLLIVIGLVISIADWNRRNRQAADEVRTKKTSALGDLAKLAEALKGQPLGMQLIIVGIVILVIAGVFGGVMQL
jgi:hypothetical protein